MKLMSRIAATVSLIKLIVEIKRSCDKTAEELKSVELAKSLGTDQITSFRTVLKSLASLFDKYNEDVIGSLDQKDKERIGEMMKDTEGVIERCEVTISKLRALTRKKVHSKSELDVLREELRGAVSTIHYLKDSFNELVTRPLKGFST